jgi:hypothetical protein
MARKGDTIPNTLADDADKILIYPPCVSIGNALAKINACAANRKLGLWGYPYLLAHIKYRVSCGWKDRQPLPENMVGMIPPEWHRHYPLAKSA